MQPGDLSGARMDAVLLRKRILFVDDESSIRLTLPPVLEQAGFQVQVAETVSDAMFEINSNSYDVLISDLNIGEEGDGFLVASAMRQVQPNCLTFILTGYPAFETALQAIHSQVDDYLVKPVEVEALVTTVREKLAQRWAESQRNKQLASLLRENLKALQREATADELKSTSEPEMSQFARALVDALAKQKAVLDSKILRLATEFGRKCKAEGYTAITLTEEFHSLQEAVYEVIQSNLKTLNPAILISDLRRFHSAWSQLLAKSIEGFCKPTGNRKISA